MNTQSSISENPAAPSTWRNGQRKDQQVIDGCKKLQAGQRQGQCFSNAEIGRACGLHGRAVEFIVRKALYKVGNALLARDKGLMAEIFQDRPMTEITGAVQNFRNPYVTGRASVRPKTAKEKQLRDRTIMTMTEVTEQIASERPKKSLKSEAERDQRRWGQSKRRHLPNSGGDISPAAEAFAVFPDITLTEQRLDVQKALPEAV